MGRCRMTSLPLLLGIWAVLLLVGAPPHGALALLYAPARGSIWDPSCIRIGGKTHCIAMHIGSNQSLNSQHGDYPYGLLYTADDGVHFRTVGPVAPEHWRGVGFFKAMISYLGPDPTDPSQPLFVMNHGTEGNTTAKPPSSGHDPGCPFASQCMRFLKSADLRNWQPLYSSHPDPQWCTLNLANLPTLSSHSHFRTWERHKGPSTLTPLASGPARQVHRWPHLVHRPLGRRDDAARPGHARWLGGFPDRHCPGPGRLWARDDAFRGWAQVRESCLTRLYLSPILRRIRIGVLLSEFFEGSG